MAICERRVGAVFANSASESDEAVVVNGTEGTSMKTI